MLSLVYTDEFKDVFDSCASGMQQKVVQKLGFLARDRRTLKVQFFGFED